MELYFKDFLEGVYGLNAPGRAGQHVWKPETPVTHYNPHEKHFSKEKLKGTNLNQGFKPLPPSPFKGLTADKLGIKTKKVPKPYI